MLSKKAITKYSPRITRPTRMLMVPKSPETLKGFNQHYKKTSNREKQTVGTHRQHSILNF